jgi:glycine cleavage system H protein
VNEDPFGDAWFVRISIADPSELEELMDAAGYQALVEKEIAAGH